MDSKLEFSALQYGKRFSNSFKSIDTNDTIAFSKKGFAVIYAPNGVGKSSLTKLLGNELANGKYSYTYGGKSYDQNSKKVPILVIGDFYGRNIAPHGDENLQDFILGNKIKNELELSKRSKIRFRTSMIK